MKGLVVAVLLLLAGCAAPDLTPIVQQPNEPAVPADSVDLHSSTLLISFTENEPSAVIQLAVTSDMWVHPCTDYAGAGCVNGAEDPTRWVLCPWVDFAGPDDGWLQVFPYWLDDQTLKPADVTGEQDYAIPHGGGKRCVSSMSTGGEAHSISATGERAPDGTMILVVTMRPADAPMSSTVWREPWQLVLGIASTVCPGSIEGHPYWRYCPPSQQVVAKPLAYLGPSTSTVYFYGYGFDGSSCGACGFTLEDQRTTLGPVHAGALTATRSMTPGLAHVSGQISGAQSISIRLASASEELTASCTDALPTFTQTMASPTGTNFTVDITGLTAETQTTGYYLSTLEIPFLPEAYSWTLEPSQHVHHAFDNLSQVPTCP